MTKVRKLAEKYREQVELEWGCSISGNEKVWFCIYSPENERKIRASIHEFEIITIQSGHTWNLVDLSGCFEKWLSQNEYSEEYFSEPGYLMDDLTDLKDFIVDSLGSTFSESDENTVISLLGIATFFGVLKASQIIELIVNELGVPGRLLVFFPGERDGNNYRLLKARDGWNYLAYPIEVEED